MRWLHCNVWRWSSYEEILDVSTLEYETQRIETADCTKYQNGDKRSWRFS